MSPRLRNMPGPALTIENHKNSTKFTHGIMMNVLAQAALRPVNVNDLSFRFLSSNCGSADKRDMKTGVQQKDSLSSLAMSRTLYSKQMPRSLFSSDMSRDLLQRTIRVQ